MTDLPPTITTKNATKFDRSMVAACVHFAKDFPSNPTREDIGKIKVHISNISKAATGLSSLI